MKWQLNQLIQVQRFQIQGPLIPGDKLNSSYLAMNAFMLKTGDCCMMRFYNYVGLFENMQPIKLITHDYSLDINIISIPHESLTFHFLCSVRLH